MGATMEHWIQFYRMLNRRNDGMMTEEEIIAKAEETFQKFAAMTEKELHISIYKQLLREDGMTEAELDAKAEELYKLRESYMETKEEKNVN